MRTLGRKSWIALGGFIFGILPVIGVLIAFSAWGLILLSAMAIPIVVFGIIGMLSGYFAYEVAAVGGALRGWIAFIAIPASLAAWLFYMAR